MTETQQLEYVKTMAGAGDTIDTLRTYLSIAGSKILNRLYPYGRGDEVIPERYHALQCEMAVYLLGKRGAEGQTGHSENGTSRTYGSADIPESMLSQIVPHVGVMSR